nr:unnamed protein product [Callosobruchus analis]
MIMEMTNEAVGRWYESPRAGTSGSPGGQGTGHDGSEADLNYSVTEHMSFFLDPSGTQRAARYYHQSMHPAYGSHGDSAQQAPYMGTYILDLAPNDYHLFCSWS